ncbi:MAG: ribosome biogenesis GTPase Der [Bacteroidetes bacterium]|nr:ribosome biogenesis GTPase Der [Bacteroidota bacterium]HET6243879.1 ribosome biogenesis GTPase Der [Bacteroidia bacterium]
MSNIVAIVGRPNVGKSTLFNRLTETRSAIVDSTSGVTRDRHYGRAEWTGREFSLIDTGGYVKGSDDVFEGEIRKQVQLAIDEANIIVFVVDVVDGITDLDKEVANLLRRTKKPVFIVANKVDNSARIAMAAEFYAFGLGEPYCLSSINGSGTGEFLDDLVKALPEDQAPDDGTEGLPKLAIVGRPNVGKSSLLNAFLGTERTIVTSTAGTTRDSINTHFQAFGHDLVLVDTAGVRKKSKVHEDLEFYSVMRSVRAIEHCDVCLLVLDATLGLESQDLNIFHLAQRNNKGLVILVNKWDLMDKETNTSKEYEEQIRETIAPFKDVPIIFISALSKQRILKALEIALEVQENRSRKISTSKLNDIMLPIIEHTPPPAVKGKFIKIKYCTQIPTYYPSFVFFANLPQYIDESYKRFIENKLRKQFNFTGVPITIYFRKK